MKIIIALMLTVALTACATKTPVKTDIVQSAYDVLVGAKAYLDKAYSLHQECTKGDPQGGTLCNDLNLAEQAKFTLATALEAFCSGTAFDTGGGPCQKPPTGSAQEIAAQTQLNQSLNAYNSIAQKLTGEL